MPQILIDSVLKANPWLKTEKNAMDYIFETLQKKYIIKTICTYSQSRS